MLFRAGSSNLLGKKVAFFVGLSTNMGPVSENTDVKFDSVVTNIGAAYNKSTGQFTTPADGVYQFNVAISAQMKQKVNWIHQSSQTCLETSLDNNTFKTFPKNAC